MIPSPRLRFLLFLHCLYVLFCADSQTIYPISSFYISISIAWSDAVCTYTHILPYITSLYVVQIFKSPHRRTQAVIVNLLHLYIWSLFGRGGVSFCLAENLVASLTFPMWTDCYIPLLRFCPVSIQRKTCRKINCLLAAESSACYPSICLASDCAQIFVFKLLSLQTTQPGQFLSRILAFRQSLRNLWIVAYITRYLNGF